MVHASPGLSRNPWGLLPRVDLNQNLNLVAVDFIGGDCAEGSIPCLEDDDRDHERGGEGGGESSVQAAWETRNPPRDLLDALLMLRMHAMLADAGQKSFRTPRGSLQVIVTPLESDRTNIKTVLPRMIGRDASMRDTIIRIDDDVTRKQTRTGVLGSIRADILHGTPVIAVMATDDTIPDDLRVAMQTTQRLPPLSRRILEAVMEFHFDQPSVELQQADVRIAQLSDIALSSVFAAEDLKTAIARLDRATAPKTRKEVTLDDVHGQPHAVGALKQVVRDLRDYKSGSVDWSDVTKSFLLLGPPGTGKSMMAEGLAGSAGINFVKTSYSDCQRHGHQGDMLKALNTAVETAIATAPGIFFIDEVDSFHNRQGRTGSKDGYILGVVNGLLTQLDRLSATRGVILVAATNYPDRVDPAVIRPGRFDRHIHVGRPDRSGLRSMLQAPLSGLTFEPVEIDRLCDQLLGSSGAEIAALIRDARTRARAERTPFSFEYLKAAADAIQPPAEPDIIWRIRKVRPHETAIIHLDHLNWLQDRLSQPHTGPSVVVTHHCPHPGLISAIPSDLDPVYGSNLTRLITQRQPDAWFFGHTHHPNEAMVGKTLVRNVSLGYGETVRLKHYAV